MRRFQNATRKSETPSERLKLLTHKGLLTKHKKYSNPTPKKKMLKKILPCTRNTQQLSSSKQLFIDDE
jgi:hypothetical protein